MTVANCLFNNNRSNDNGGGIFVEDGELTITASRFTDNASNNGGGVLCRNGSLAVDDSEFTGNSGYGGGIGSRSCDCTITNSRFFDNYARYWAGAVSINSASGTPPSTSSIINCVFINNRSDDRAGAIAVFREGLTITNSTFTLNRADNGGRRALCRGRERHGHHQYHLLE